jgi:hypothetical protein
MPNRRSCRTAAPAAHAEPRLPPLMPNRGYRRSCRTAAPAAHAEPRLPPLMPNRGYRRSCRTAATAAHAEPRLSPLMPTRGGSDCRNAGLEPAHPLRATRARVPTFPPAVDQQSDVSSVVRPRHPLSPRSEHSPRSCCCRQSRPTASEDADPRQWLLMPNPAATDADADLRRPPLCRTAAKSWSRSICPVESVAGLEERDLRAAVIGQAR